MFNPRKILLQGKDIAAMIRSSQWVKNICQGNKMELGLYCVDKQRNTNNV